MIIDHFGRLHEIPLATFNGQYAACYNSRINIMLILELPAPQVPGTPVMQDDYMNSRPLLAVQIDDLRSLNVIRDWLKTIERCIAIKWHYKDGD